VRLGDVLPFKYGKNLPSRNRTNSGEFQVLSSAGITGSHDAALTDRPTVVIGRKGSIGTVYYCPKPVWPIDTTFYVEPSGDVDTRFAYYLLQQLPLKQMNNDSAVPGLNRAQAENLIVEIPSLDGQKAIVKILGSLDDKIESNRRIQLLCEKLVRSYVFELLDALTQKNGELQDYCSLVKDQVKTADFDEDDNYVGLEHMPRRSLILESWGTAGGLGSNKTRFRKGDILFGKLRPYFKKVVIAPIDGICSTDILVFRAKQPRDVGLVAAIAASDPLIDHVSSASTGTRMPRTSWHDIAKWNVPILNDGECSRLSGKTTPLVNEMMQLTFENQKLTLLRDTLLPELLSGRISVSCLREKVSE
jgi:type I restriction enzyme S subunit